MRRGGDWSAREVLTEEQALAAARSIRRLRAERKWSFRALARNAGMAPATAGRAEDGTYPLTAEAAELIAAAFGMTLAELLDGGEVPGAAG